MYCIARKHAAFKATQKEHECMHAVRPSRRSCMHGSYLNTRMCNANQRVSINKRAYSVRRTLSIFALSEHQQQSTSTTTVRLIVEGMMCGGCSGRVEEVLQVSEGL